LFHVVIVVLPEHIFDSGCVVNASKHVLMVLKDAAGNHYPRFLCPFQDAASYESCTPFEIRGVVCSSDMLWADALDVGHTGVF
jgi:hypothetical protein